MRCVLLGLCLHQLPLHQVPGDPGLHRRHGPLRHQRLLRLPPVLGCAPAAVRGGEGGGAHTEHHGDLSPGGLLRNHTDHLHGVIPAKIRWRLQYLLEILFHL